MDPSTSPNNIPAWDEDDESSSSMLDIIVILAQNRRLITRITVIFFLLGLSIAIFSTPLYTANAKIIREPIEQQLGAGSALSALQGFGINLGFGSAGLSEETYPVILNSREIGLATVRSFYYFSDIDSVMTLVAYDHYSKGWLGSLFAGLKNVTVRLPGKILNSLRGSSHRMLDDSAGPAQLITMEEDESIRWLKNKIGSSIDRKSGVMDISVTTMNPALSVAITEILLAELTERIQSIMAKKVGDNLNFVVNRFEEASEALEISEVKLAEFSENNRDITSPLLRIEQERLKRQVQFKTQIYSELLSQKVQLELDFQRSKPVITLVERPLPPFEKSAPRRTLIVLVSLFFGLAIGIGTALALNASNKIMEDEQSRSQIDDIFTHLSGGLFFWTKWLRR